MPSQEEESDAPEDRLAVQLANLNEQLAVQNRRRYRIWTVVAVVLALWVVYYLVIFFFVPVLYVPAAS